MAVLTGSSSAVADAPIDRCWALVEDVAIAPEWQGGLVQMDVLERDAQGRALVCDALSDAKLRKVKTRVRFTYEGPTRLSWTMVEGDLTSMDGSWELEDLGDGRTKVTYALAVDPGSIPPFVRGPIEKAARAILVNGRADELARRVTQEP
jgi:ribosome-associated toxin RatA of RatAB toxin-antitoxin module